MALYTEGEEGLERGQPCTPGDGGFRSRELTQEGRRGSTRRTTHLLITRLERPKKPEVGAHAPAPRGSQHHVPAHGCALEDGSRGGWEADYAFSRQGASEETVYLLGSSSSVSPLPHSLTGSSSNNCILSLSLRRKTELKSKVSSALRGSYRNLRTAKETPLTRPCGEPVLPRSSGSVSLSRPQSAFRAGEQDLACVNCSIIPRALFSLFLF